MWLTSVKRVVSACVNIDLECSRDLAAGCLLWSGNQSRRTSVKSEIFTLFSVLISADILLLRQRPASWGTEKQKYPETRLAWDTWTKYVSWGLVGNSTLCCLMRWSETALTGHVVRVQGHFIQELGKISWNLSLQKLSKTDNPDTAWCGWQLTFPWPALQWSSDCRVKQINNCFNKTE